MVPDADLRIKLPVFEGPLDLLLFLIRKNELDIYDIPIATVTKQYIEVIRSMRELDLDIAGEFFVMAASLMEIKSRMLLPRGQAATGETTEDDPLDPRWELVHQLLQYKKFKEAAAKLDELASFQRDMLARHVVEVAVTENERPLKPVDRIELWNSFNIVLRRLAEKLVVGEIKGEEVTVSDKMEELLRLIQTRPKFLFTDLFEGQPVTVRVLVATFIAVLELTRLKKLRVRQDEAYSDIFVEAVEDAPPALDAPPETLALESTTPSGETIPAAHADSGQPDSHAPSATVAAVAATHAETATVTAAETATDDEFDEHDEFSDSESASLDADDARPLAFIPSVIGATPEPEPASEQIAEPPPESSATTEPASPSDTLATLSESAPQSRVTDSSEPLAVSPVASDETITTSETPADQASPPIVEPAPAETEKPLETPGEGRTLAP